MQTQVTISAGTFNVYMDWSPQGDHWATADSSPWGSTMYEGLGWHFSTGMKRVNAFEWDVQGSNMSLNARDFGEVYNAMWTGWGAERDKAKTAWHDARRKWEKTVVEQLVEALNALLADTDFMRQVELEWLQLEEIKARGKRVDAERMIEWADGYLPKVRARIQALSPPEKVEGEEKE